MVDAPYAENPGCAFKVVRLELHKRRDVETSLDRRTEIEREHSTKLLLFRALTWKENKMPCFEHSCSAARQGKYRVGKAAGSLRKSTCADGTAPISIKGLSVLCIDVDNRVVGSLPL